MIQITVEELFDGTDKIDATTLHMLQTVYTALGEEQQKKFAKMLYENIGLAVDIAWKLIK